MQMFNCNRPASFISFSLNLMQCGSNAKFNSLGFRAEQNSWTIESLDYGGSRFSIKQLAFNLRSETFTA